MNSIEINVQSLHFTFFLVYHLFSHNTGAPNFSYLQEEGSLDIRECRYFSRGIARFQNWNKTFIRFMYIYMCFFIPIINISKYSIAYSKEPIASLLFLKLTLKFLRYIHYCRKFIIVIGH